MHIVHNSEDLLRTAEAAKYTGVTQSWLRRLAASGRGPQVADRSGRGRGRGNAYKRGDLDAWMRAGKGYACEQKESASGSDTAAL